MPHKVCLIVVCDYDNRKCPTRKWIVNVGPPVQYCGIETGRVAVSSRGQINESISLNNTSSSSHLHLADNSFLFLIHC